MAVNFLGGFDKEVLKFLEDLEFQTPNKFSFFLIRDVVSAIQSSVSDPLSALSATQIASSVVGVPFDLAVAQFYLRSIELPTGITFEYEQANENKYVARATYPESVTMTFFEDENGVVIRYLKEWERDIAYPDPYTIRNASDLLKGNALLGGEGFVFRSNQEYSKRTGMLILGSGIDERKRGAFRIPDLKSAIQGEFDSAVTDLEDQLLGQGPQQNSAVSRLFSRIAGQSLNTAKKVLGNLPQKYPRIMLYGMRPKNLGGNIKIGHDERDNLIYTVEISVEEISIPLLL